jgi:hypothetical protein
VPGIVPASTDCAELACQHGSNQYWEVVQQQAYTNKGNIFGDWIGREAKGGQAWLTWHLSGNEWVSAEYLHKKTASDFIAGGVTQNQFRVDLVKRVGPALEVRAWFQQERWAAPIYMKGAQDNSAISLQLTYFPPLTSTAK